MIAIVSVGAWGWIESWEAIPSLNGLVFRDKRVREAEFKAWLVAQGYAPTSIATWLSDGRKVDGAYGLDEQFDRDGGASILAEMAYSRSDDAAGRPNPSAMGLFPVP